MKYHYCSADHSVHLTISANFTFPRSAPCERANYVGVVLEKGNSDQVVTSTWAVLENDVKFVPFPFKCEKGIIFYFILNFLILFLFFIRIVCVFY